ncbi:MULTISPECIES: hypothetical protein [unclassified Rhodococcus (in: high G+C Gram-positive bacteria)]|nr:MULTISPECIES: hypothetical protein [unclassified Rhodococcus (in: high G+C Gram-positive bacteria)]MDQ1179465.1 excinuclease UvrABC ATPase subunit [Rhodococcus sp. SORGH_AS_0301]MDQ1200758.1 excinuclease UvrABC ATPase subunit [Rhodococcus sp. SORGH_AS_0303]
MTRDEKAGGHIVATGTPDDVAADPSSITGHYLHDHLRAGLVAGDNSRG